MLVYGDILSGNGEAAAARQPAVGRDGKVDRAMPEPELPEVMVIQAGTLLVAVQLQPAGAVTFALIEPPAEATEVEARTRKRQAIPSSEGCTTPEVVGKFSE